MVADYFILSMSDSIKLSVLSVEPAARIVIPFKIVTTNSVLRLVVKNVFRFVSYNSVLVIDDFTHLNMFESFCRSRRSLILETAIRKPPRRTIAENFVCTYKVPAIKLFKKVK